MLLFTERAAAAGGDFELTAANQGAVTELCRRLDGLPLAIELAAVRTRVLSAEQILARLSDRFTLLAAGNGAARPRHQTLRTTIDWSHDLLSDDERAVLRRCCVFADRFTLDDVEGVCAGGQVPAGQVLDLLTALVSKSLLIRESRPGPAAWYRLHETMREFARLKLAEAGEEEATWRRCADYYLAACRRTGVDRRYQLPEWLAWVPDEVDNLRAVLQRCLQGGDTAGGLGLAATLGWYWATRATSEGLRWLSQFTAPGADPQLLAWAGFWHGFLRYSRPTRSPPSRSSRRP